MKRLAIIVPCYNEEEAIEGTAKRLTELISCLIVKQKISQGSYILFVNDGSTDATWKKITHEFECNPFVNALSLTSNFGQQNALLAGLTEVCGRCDMAVTVDADLQDDISVMEQMTDMCENGADIVYGVRNDRSSDSFIKRTTAHMFYRLMKLLGTKTVYNHAEYRLMSARAIGELLKYKESNVFVRGIIPLMGLPSGKVYYARKPRTAGKSKYSLRKMTDVAIEGVTSLSIKPISIITAFGLLILTGALVAFVCLMIFLVLGKRVSGWGYVLSSVWLLGGLQLTAIGVIGEYTGKTYFEVKNRPRYHTDRILWHDNTEGQ